jgi:hypothetical protein
MTTRPLISSASATHSDLIACSDRISAAAKYGDQPHVPAVGPKISLCGSRERTSDGRPYLIGGGLVQCSWATASVHVEPSGCNTSQVSASLPASIR